MSDSSFSILDPFETLTIPVGEWVESLLAFFQNYGDFFRAIRWPVDQVLNGIEAGLLAVPPLLMIMFLAMLAWQVAGRKMGWFCLALLLGIGFLGVWKEAMTTLALVLTSLFFCALIGIPMGIWAARNDTVERILRPVLDTMQTLPAFVYLVPVVTLFGIGEVPGVMVTIVFALPPLVRLTNLGIRQVPADKVEAALSFGCTKRQLLTRVQLPLATPTIMAGINQTLMLSLSMVVIASMISVAGLGQMVLRGIGRFDMGLATVGGIGIVLLAIFLDRITQAMGDRAATESNSKWHDGGPIGFIKQRIK